MHIIAHSTTEASRVTLEQDGLTCLWHRLTMRTSHCSLLLLLLYYASGQRMSARRCRVRGRGRQRITQYGMQVLDLVVGYGRVSKKVLTRTNLSAQLIA